MDEANTASREAVADFEGSTCEWRLPDEVGVHLAAVLADESRSVAKEWHESLKRRLGLRPSRIFPTEDVLNHVPVLVEHLFRALHPGNGKLTPEILADVQDLVRIRHAQGYGVEEMLAETDLLADIMFQRLYAALRRNSYVSPGASAAATACLSDAVRALNCRIVGFYRDLVLEADMEASAHDLQHELRDPLGVILQNLELLADDEWIDGPARTKLRARMERAVTRISEIVDSLPGMLERLGEDPEAATLRSIIPTVMDDVNDSLAGHDVELRVEGEIPDIEVDRLNTALALHNLVANAVKYSDPAKEARWVRIAFEAAEEDGRWIVQIGDNGLGVPRDQQEKIFERYVRSHEGRAEGYGLGLSIARDAVRRMGGRIGLESEEGQGSTFFFTVSDLRQDADSAG